MGMATMTILSLEDFMKKTQNASLFDELELPDGVEKKDVVDKIMLDSSEFEVLDSNPYFLRAKIGNWSRINQNTFNRLYRTLTEEYNPLHNFDRHEEYKDSNTGKVSQNGTSGGTTDTSAVAYDTYQEKKTGSTSDSNRSQNDTDSTSENVHTGHLYGNIGVTESTAMAQHEIDFRMKNSFAGLVADLFVREFCLMIY